MHNYVLLARTSFQAQLFHSTWLSLVISARQSRQRNMGCCQNTRGLMDPRAERVLQALAASVSFLCECYLLVVGGTTKTLRG